MPFSSEKNHAAYMIKSIMSKEYEISIFSKSMTYLVAAQIEEIDVSRGRLSLQVFSEGRDISRYVDNGLIYFDIEAKMENDETEILNFEKVKTQVIKRDRNLYELKCQLTDSVFIHEGSGGVRIPFILGMRARVSIEVYEKELVLKANLRNLSMGGCMVDMPIEDSAVLSIDQMIPGMSIEFPNGRSFYTKGCIRHIRPFGNSGHAAIGIHFIGVDSALKKELSYFVYESEREAASRTGMKASRGTSMLFVAGEKEKKILHREKKEKEQYLNQPSMVRGVREVAKQLQVMLMFMKNRNVFPEDNLYDCADTLLFLVGKDRKKLLYALSILRDEPDWVRHAVQVAASLADYMISKDPHAGTIREAVVGALLHTMGKPLLLSRKLPSLKISMAPHQKKLLKGHVNALLEKLELLGWQPSDICRDIILNSNERLDGGGYPAGKTPEALSDIVRLVSLIKIVNKLTSPRNEVAPRTPLDAYRWVSEHSEAYDKALLIEYIQLYGLYPIGSLARFSQGFLAWITDIGPNGKPNTVHVVKNLSFRASAIDTVLSSSDFVQIGKFESIVNPDDYNIRHRKV